MLPVPRKSAGLTASKEQLEAIRTKYQRASNRRRKGMVQTFLLQGQTTEKMAKLLGVDEDEVTNHFLDAVEEIQSELELIPEGPLHASEIVIEGYSRLVQRILASCEEAQARLGASTFVDPKAELAAQGYMKLSLEAFDKLTDRMEKYGLLPTVRSMGSHGGVRPGSTHQLKDNFNEVIREFAVENGVDLEAEIEQATKDSVGR